MERKIEKIDYQIQILFWAAISSIYGMGIFVLSQFLFLSEPVYLSGSLIWGLLSSIFISCCLAIVLVQMDKLTREETRRLKKLNEKKK